MTSHAEGKSGRKPSLWLSPEDQMPQPGVEVMAIVVRSGGVLEDAQNVIMVHKEGPDADWVTADDGSELNYDWKVVKWMPIQKPSEEVLASTSPEVQAYIVALEENARVLETRNRRVNLRSNTLRKEAELRNMISEQDTGEVAKLKAIIESMTEEVLDKTDDLARMTSQRDRADKRAHEAFLMLREIRDKNDPESTTNYSR